VACGIWGFVALVFRIPLTLHTGYDGTILQAH
jgi:hypothetical protein